VLGKEAEEILQERYAVYEEALEEDETVSVVTRIFAVIINALLDSEGNLWICVNKKQKEVVEREAKLLRAIKGKRVELIVKEYEG